jgi:peptidyl-prolyl cis-trans isomerase D
MVQKLNQGGKLADEAASAGLKIETANGLKRETAVPGLPASAIEAAFRNPKDGAGQVQGAGASEWIVFRVTEVSAPPIDLASEIGTSINQAAFAQVTGANN